MNDTLEKAENAVANFRHALEIENGSSAYVNLRNIERNSMAWIPELAAECKAYRKFAMTAATVSALAATCEKDPQKLIYVCSPCRGNVKVNIAAARRYCYEVIGAGYVPIAPHVMFDGMLDDNLPDERAAGMRMGLELLRFCSELWAYGPYVSFGMRKEIELAEALKIPVKYIKVVNGNE